MKKNYLKQLIKEEIQSILKEWGGGIDDHGRDAASRRDWERRESMTPKDNWGNDIKGYIMHLMDSPTEDWVIVNGKKELKTLRGFDAVESRLARTLDDKTSYSHEHAKGREYLDWMKEVRKTFEQLKNSGQLKDMSDKEKEEEEDEEDKYWENYYKKRNKSWGRS